MHAICLVIRAPAPERKAAVETILSFDVDWMRGQSVGVFPVHNATPEPIIAELEKITDSGEGGLTQNMIKFQPISRLNAILVVSRKPDYLKTVATWIRRLDKSDTAGVNLKVYRLRYGSAKQIAGLLNDILVGRGAGGLDTAAGQIAPGGGISVASSGGPLAALSAQPPSAAGQAGGASGAGLGSGLGAGANRPATTGGAAGGATPGGATGQGGAAAGTAAAGNAFGAGGTGQALIQNIRITPDIVNNSILVYANQDTQHIVEQTLRQIDRPPMQVAIDATVAEVTLNDQLTYGVQYYLQHNNFGAFSTLGTSALSAVVPGFNLVLGPAGMPNVVLDALHSITDIRVLSNPSLVVLDNQPAVLQVGDQVPISTGSATVRPPTTPSSAPSTTATPASSCASCRASAPTAMSSSTSSRKLRASRRGRRRATTPDADDLRPQRQEHDLSAERPDRAARRLDQRRSRPHAVGHSGARQAARHW